MRTGSLVKPIMKKHDWKVGTLAEVSLETPPSAAFHTAQPLLIQFVPGDPSLLGKGYNSSCPSYGIKVDQTRCAAGMNQNRGYKILLRLRPHEAQNTFYDQEQLVLVMLHEVSLT
jgi:hypothetical protein